MKEEWDLPEDERWCETCKNRLARALVEEPVRLDEVVYIKSGDDYFTSIEVPNATDGRRCKVVVDVTLKIKEDEDEDAKQERARAEVSRKINKWSHCYAKVVNADDGKRLGEYRTRVFVKEDAVNDLYVEKKNVLRALANTQNGARPQPEKEHGPFYRDARCNCLERARELFDEEQYKLVLERELDRFPKNSTQEDEDQDEDEDEEDADEEEDEDIERRYVTCSHGSRVDVDFETFPQAAEEFFYRRPVVRAYGNRAVGHLSSTPKEVVTKVLRQSRANVVSQLRIGHEELLEQLKAGEVPALEEAGINVPSDLLKSMVGDVRKALKGMPFDADESDRNWRSNRFKHASCVAMGVMLLEVEGVPMYVVRKNPKYKYDFTDDGHAKALEKALELSPSLRKLYEDSCAVQSLLSELSAEEDADDENYTGLRSKEIFDAMMKNVRATLRSREIDIPLVATEERPLRALQIGFNFKKRATPEKTLELWERAEAATVALGQVGQFEVVEKVNELASGPDGLKREALAEAYKLDLVDDKKKLDILEEAFVVGTTYRRDMAMVESLRVMPMPMAVYTEGYPKYWIESGKAHLVAHNVAQQCNKHRYALGTILEEAEAKGLLED